jgi:hypothetical protein
VTRADVAAAYERLDAAMAELRQRRPDVGVYASTYGDDRACVVLELTRFAHNHCDHCNHKFSVEQPRAVYRIDADTGGAQETRRDQYAHEHDCGGGNSPPLAMLRYVPLDTTLDATCLLSEALTELDQAVEREVRYRERAVWAVETMRLQLALRRLSRGKSPEEVTTGSRTEPGVFHDGVRWISWNWAPLSDGEIIWVSEETM